MTGIGTNATIILLYTIRTVYESNIKLSSYLVISFRRNIQEKKQHNIIIIYTSYPANNENY